jgi:hypothetical protein
MYKVTLYIDGQRADLFQDESIEMNITTQNVSDISKVFSDYSKGFTIPASPTNNGIFKHYYNVDINGGFDASLRVDAFIEINSNVFRDGVLELEEVQMKDGEAYAYSVSFYSNTTALKDLFGDDKLNDLDLSAYDHTYNDTNIVTGLNGYVSGTSSSIIYPLISPVRNWYYDSSGSNHNADNIHYHSGHPEHGVFYYDLKPAIKIQKIIDAIESKYSVTFESDFFDSADFGKLFMWCHRRAGYMFKDQGNGFTPQVINFTTNNTGDYNLTTQKYTVTAAQEADLRVRYTLNSTDDYKIIVYINDELYTSRSHSGNVSNETIGLGTRDIGDTIQFRFSPADDWDASAVSINTTTFYLEYDDGASWQEADTVGRLAAQSITSTVEVSEQMPEQKISDFLSSLIRAFNLVVVPTAPNKYDIEPLDDWYGEGTTREISQYVDTTETTIKRTELYRRIEFKYNETEAILGEQYRLQNYIGYGDLRADFDFDGEEFGIEVGFDHMLFERLVNHNNGLTTIGVGKSITREIEPYIGSPLIFYLAGQIRGTEQFAYVDMTGSENAKTDFHLVSNVNSDVATSVTKTLNFGTEIDPYHLQAFSTGLYSTYWKDYITDLYDASRRLFVYKANLPLGIMLALKTNDKLTIQERNYRINNVDLNLTTGEATLELLNDV